MASVCDFLLAAHLSTPLPLLSPKCVTLAFDHPQNFAFARNDTFEFCSTVRGCFKQGSVRVEPLQLRRSLRTRQIPIMASLRHDPLRIMISGAPASGKGTQCELLIQKYGLVHISAGDLLRADVAAGTEKGKQAKQYMEQGQLVPDDIVVMMVKERLSRHDASENGWLLDGYPRSLSQAEALETLGIRPDVFILLDVTDEILVERVVGRRLDPVTGKIYHLKYFPPENQEIAERLTQRFDDTEEKVKLRLQTHHRNVEAVLSVYEDILIKVDGNAHVEFVFARIDEVLTGLVEQKAADTSVASGVL